VKLFSGQNAVVLEWLSKRVDFALSPQTQLLWASTGFEGPILGAIGFGGLMGKTFFSVSIALDSSKAAIPLVRAAVQLGFGIFGGKAAYINISSKRGEWIQSLERVMGFVEVDRVPDGLRPGETLIMLKLTPETCRPWQAELKKLARMQVREVA
jgi:hypothetical protein